VNRKVRFLKKGLLQSHRVVSTFIRTYPVTDIPDRNSKKDEQRKRMAPSFLLSRIGDRGIIFPAEGDKKYIALK